MEKLYEVVNSDNYASANQTGLAEPRLGFEPSTFGFILVRCSHQLNYEVKLGEIAQRWYYIVMFETQSSFFDIEAYATIRWQDWLMNINENICMINYSYVIA